ncbi:LytR/AlgR family response regulator transcription factor [Massilia yuzhufengensis]|uniref:Two component transcriptional regulator, LytTR family n=1 Tax=Massilia yuzhufengensis TaxID=1164594 RepID=A0A1I1GYU5_9BURK|nr:LytTR family DNA-binding domain-containing protein [Massilia yuzhufengensis]SFC15048.1 two component transcriptional regulator, LytTR family [Massilia yuzhufengensis]
MRILIVDDERPARERLRRMLALEPGIDAIVDAADGHEALRVLEAFRPDALLLDVEMPELSGFDLAASLPLPAPLVVFVTAYDAYALRAFDANAIDYLLKPFDQARLRRALERLRTRLAAANGAAAATGLPPRQLLVTERGATRVVQVADIEWLETADNYVVLHTAQGSPLLRQTLAALLEQLGGGFVRCHRRAAVRVGAVERIVALDKGDCELVLRSGAVVPCSRQYRAALMATL